MNNRFLIFLKSNHDFQLEFEENEEIRDDTHELPHSPKKITRSKNSFISDNTNKEVSFEIPSPIEIE